jgi:hypothetical protein
MEDEYVVAIISQHRNGQLMVHPHDVVVVEAGDRFVASASISALHKLSSLTPPTREYSRYLQGNWKIKTKK